jgi:isoleucyl-tRNA synthetase
MKMSVSDEILKRMADSYRRMRNTMRFLLGQSAWLRSCGTRGAVA